VGGLPSNDRESVHQIDTGAQRAGHTVPPERGKLEAMSSAAGRVSVPAASFSPLVCPRCGSLPDAARVNPATGIAGRKCGECGHWQELPSPFRRWQGDRPLDAS
jgi:hypothetical protein